MVLSTKERQVLIIRANVIMVLNLEGDAVGIEMELLAFQCRLVYE